MGGSFYDFEISAAGDGRYGNFHETRDYILAQMAVGPLFLN